ncbi:hypothetical protein IGI04_012804, partial [Brassica rapa subsp. trilocularis]
PLTQAKLVDSLEELTGQDVYIHLFWSGPLPSSSSPGVNRYQGWCCDWSNDDAIVWRIGVVKSACSIGFRFREVEASRAPSPSVLFPGGGGFLSSAFAGLSLRGVKVVMCLASPASGFLFPF